jgi:hypothetical protein
MRGRESAHRNANDMGLLEFQRIQDRPDIIASPIL